MTRMVCLSAPLSGLLCVLCLPGILMCQCQSVAGGSWIEPGGESGNRTFTLSQDVSTGEITGSSYRAICQSTTWPVTGEWLGNGEFTITITNPSPSDPRCVADWVTYTGTVSLPGCDITEDLWAENSEAWGDYLEWTKPSDIPSQETYHADGFDLLSGYRALGYWDMTISTSNGEVNFGGRSITETFPQNGTDACYFPGSSYSAIQKPATPWGTWTVGSIESTPGYFNQYGFDRIGWGTENMVDYYMSERPSRGLSLPCYYTVSQQMKIGTRSGPTVYKNTSIRSGIDVIWVYSQKASQTQTQGWPPE
jgi:hypothetical protein